MISGAGPGLVRGWQCSSYATCTWGIGEMAHGRDIGIRWAMLVGVLAVAGGCIGEASPAAIRGAPTQVNAPEPSTTAQPSPTPTRGASTQAKVPDPSTTTQPSAPPSSRPPEPSPTFVDLGCAALVETPPPLPLEPSTPPIQDPTIRGKDVGAIEAITRAAERLAALDSYRFSVGVLGRDVVALEWSPLDFALRGTLTRSNGLAIDALIGTRLRESNGTDASVSSSSQLVLGDGYIWELDNVSQVLEPMPVGSLEAAILPLLPDGLAARVVVPFAGGYERVGEERRDGIETVHYRASKEGAAAYSTALHFGGDLAADLWIASGDGHVTAVRIEGSENHVDEATGATIEDWVLIEFSVTQANDATNVVDLPARPVPDPVRPSGPPVDLQLEYRVMSPAGIPVDLHAIGVTLRTRLDVSARPTDVTVIAPDRLVVTVCDTTHPDEDLALIAAIGAVTVVPLPADDYGSSSKPGRLARPAVGSTIDPALDPIAPPAAMGLTSPHVDPVTGHRGVAFHPRNADADALRAYAEKHLGEYVAVVLDGNVLAVIPIDERVATGRIAFTGDYTEAESRRFARNLYREPLPFPLELVHEVKVPASGS
jgi:hypothetical protein